MTTPKSDPKTESKTDAAEAKAPEQNDAPEIQVAKKAAKAEPKPEVGVDGKNPVTPNNPLAKAVIE